MADEQMMAGEQNEDKSLDQIIQLAESGNPQALPQIAEIAKGMKANQSQEEQGLEGGEPEGPQGMAARVMDRLKQGE